MDGLQRSINCLSDADRSKLLKDRYIVCDKRKDGQKTKLYKMQIATTINSPVYQESTPAERVGLLSQVQRQADNIARQRLWNEDPEFRERMMEWTAQKNRLKFGQ